MLDNDTEGLWCREDRVWYYLEHGDHSITNPINHIKNTLIARGKITFDITGVKRNKEPYLRMSYAEAKEKDFECKPIFLNAHIRQVYESQEEERQKLSPWG